MQKLILIVTDTLQKQFDVINEQAIKNGHQIVYITPNDFSHPNWPTGMGQKIKHINPDCIHIATEGPVGLAARLWCCGIGYKYTTSYLADYSILQKLHHMSPTLTRKYLRWFHQPSERVLTIFETVSYDLEPVGFLNLVTWTHGTECWDIFDDNLVLIF